VSRGVCGHSILSRIRTLVQHAVNVPRASATAGRHLCRSFKPSFDATKAVFTSLQGFDTSKLHYDVPSSGLTDTTVHLHGTITSTRAGGQTVPVDETDDLQASGLGWCLSADTFGSS
jgi:hypothetical protein